MNGFKILAPTDHSPASRHALRLAVQLAQDLRGSVIVLHVTPDWGTTARTDDAFAAKSVDLVTLLGPSHGDIPPVPFERRDLHGDPATKILELAETEQVDLIVMGTAGRTGVRRWFMGSVAETIVRRSHRPVVTVREPPRSSSASTGADHEPLDEVVFEPDPSDVITRIELTEADAAAPATALLWRAISSRATDIHLSPFADQLHISLRIDGRIEPHGRLNRAEGTALISQFKQMADFKIADPFQAQEGHLRLPAALAGFDARLTTIPVIGGDAAAIRLFNRHRMLRPLDSLGFSHAALAAVHQMLRSTEGLTLVTGPMGSGKTTTIYSMLHALNDGTRNIVTIEDPVETHVESFRQVSVDLKHNLTIASGLKTLLRMDPDLVMVGEIRDNSAAEMVLRAASAGRYVFSSLHARDAAATVTALRDLRMDNRSLAANLKCIISQRLIRRLCGHCRQPRAVEPHEHALFTDLQLPIPDQVQTAVGCPRCRQTGYRERVGVFEVVPVTEGFVRAIANGATEQELRTTIRREGCASLLVDGLTKVAAGVTSLEEVRTMSWCDFVDT